MNHPIIERFYGALILRFGRLHIVAIDMSRGWYLLERNGDAIIPSAFYSSNFLTRIGDGKCHRLAAIDKMSDNLFNDMKPKKMVTRINLMTGLPFEEPEDTPPYLSPAYESYWSA